MKTPKVLTNIFSLSLIQMADYALPLLIIPFLIRTIGIGEYGKIAFIQGFSIYLLMLTDYGFNLSGTRLAAVNRDNKETLSHTFWSIQMVKTLLAISSLIIAIVFYCSVDKVHQYGAMWFVVILPVIGSVFYPVWVLQGLELIKSAALIMLSVRLMLLGAIFLFVTSSNDTLLAAILITGSTSISGLLSWLLLFKSKKIRFFMPQFKDIIDQFKTGWHVFLATASSNVYRSSNTVALGFMSTPEVVAYFSLAEKLVKACQELSRPIVQATYPRVSQYAATHVESAIKLLKKLLFAISGITFLASMTLFFFAPFIIRLLTGEENSQAIMLLRLVALIPLIGGLNSVLGVQTLLPFSFNKQFSKFVLTTGIFSLTIMIPLIYVLGGIGAGINYLLSELFLLIQLLLFHKKMGISILKERIKS